MTGRQMTNDMQKTYSQTWARAERPDVSIKCHLLATLLLLLLVAMYTSARADAILQGRVIGVHGGDTLTLLDAQQREHRIRLAYIETPAIAQPFGDEAQTALATLVLNRGVKLQMLAKSADGGQQAEVISASGKNVNLELLNRGLAWHDYFDRQSAAARERYQAALLEAQRERRGMWSLDRLEPPRDFRARREQLLRWWWYATAVGAALLLYLGIFAVYGRRINAWLAKQDSLIKATAEEYREARIAAETAEAERERTREIANREMERLAEERRQRMQSARNSSATDQTDQE